MLDLYELSQFAAFADLGTLSRVADKFNISTPSITRSMQKVEESFGVPLFIRGKNRIELNETGKAAAEAARKLLAEADQTVHDVQEFDQRQHTIVIRSSAPAPLWELQHILNTENPNMMISSAICQNTDVLSAWNNGLCDIAILPFYTEGAEPFMTEDLFVCVPHSHELAKHSSLSFDEINGFNFLLRTELGFWDTLCREKMPASKFLVQSDSAVFDELVRASSLPCFTTSYARLQKFSGRINIPISDDDAHITFYILKRAEYEGRAGALY